jgi:hypothetical protein
MSYDPEWYKLNRETHLSHQKAYRERNKEKERLRHKLYKKNNLDKHADYERRRRAKKRNLNREPYTTSQVLEMYGTLCHICSGEIDFTAPRRSGRPGWEKGLHIDHVKSLHNDGTDTLDNVRPSHGSCNLSKNRYQLRDKD